jgi:murein DD-endopeptidase MepM/ murein hydrolase activator NlpD
MSSAKRTPRYVDVIRPFEVTDGGNSAEVIRLRPEPFGRTHPPITKAWPRLKAVPVGRRPWQLLLVPPMPGTAPRTYNIARWQARLALAIASIVVVIAGAGVTAFVVAIRSPDLFATSAEAASLRERLSVVEDSLALARAELEGPDDSLAAGAVAASAEPVAPPSAARRPLARLALPSLRRAPTRSAPSAADDDVAGLAGSSFEGLPVIGSIASRFSRARWHPLLHVIRPHLGVDVAAPRGTKITAPAPGRVTYVGRKFGFGLVIEIEHADGVTTRYAHCGKALVTEGARVLRGMTIATVGSSGLSTGPHLHYEVLVHGHQVDPLRFRMPNVGDNTAAVAAPLVTGGAPAAAAVIVPAPITMPTQAAGVPK